MSKTITTRISNKIDTEQNWNSVNLPALEGELIVYSADESHSSPRVKIGDGTTPIKDLPFIGATGSGGIPVAVAYYNNENHAEGYYEYDVTIEGVTELYQGLQVIIIPEGFSFWVGTHINVNKLGAYPIVRHGSSDSARREWNYDASFSGNTPMLLVYDSNRWIAVAHAKPEAEDILGGTLREKIIAYNPGNGEDYTGKQVRNSFLIAEGEDLPTNAANGDICYIYEL